MRPSAWIARSRGRRAATLAMLLATAASLAACRQDMHDQPRYEPMEQSHFFADARAARSLPAGTVARGQLRTDTHFFQGKINGHFAESLPMPVDRGLLERGRERYDIYCSPCHDRTGSGRGMIVRRGYLQPPSFHIERLRKQVPGYFFNAITNGFGKMPSYALQVPVADRWASVAYIRALQLSQHTVLSDVPPAERVALAATQ